LRALTPQEGARVIASPAVLADRANAPSVSTVADAPTSSQLAPDDASLVACLPRPTPPALPSKSSESELALSEVEGVQLADDAAARTDEGVASSGERASPEVAVSEDAGDRVEREVSHAEQEVSNDDARPVDDATQAASEPDAAEHAPAHPPTMPAPEARARTLISAVLSGRSAERAADEPVTRPLTAAELERARASRSGELTPPFADLTSGSAAESKENAEAALFNIRPFDPHRTLAEFSRGPAASAAAAPLTNRVEPQPSAASDTPAPSAAPPAARKRSGLREHVQLTLTLAALATVGYLGQRYVTAHGGVSAAWKTLTHASSPPTAARHSALETSLRSGTDPSLVAGESLPYIDRGRGVSVAADQGLLVIEYAGADPAPHVAVDGHELGVPPIAVALPAARHELTVQHNLDAVVRTLIVTAGETRIVSLPLPTH
jgi:hypothetical protein